MRLGIGTMLKSPILRLACVATLVFSGLLVRVDPVGALAGEVHQVNSVHLERRTEEHHHQAHLEGHQNQQGHHHHLGSKEEEKARFVAQNNGHHRHRHRHHKRPKHRRKKGHKHKGKKHRHHDHDHDDNKPRVATFGILECENRTISAVFCPDGKLQRPGAQLFELAEMYTFSNSKRPEKKGHSRRISHLDIIRMKGPCPKPIKKDIDAAIKRLSPEDRKLIPYFFNLEFYSKALEAEEVKGALDLHNTGGKDKDKCDHGHWNDKCTSIGTFCGSQIFGCNTLDDGVYKCDSIGGKPKLVEICAIGGCVNRGSAAPSGCKNTDCTCNKSGEVCGSSFSPTCGLKKGSLYFCKTKGEKPVHVKVCETGACDSSTNKCTFCPDADCLCKFAGPVCSTDFDPKKCQLEDTALYECKAPGVLPVETKKCKHGYCDREKKECKVTPLPDECLCKKPGQVCSVDFPDTCKYRAGTLFLCPGPNHPPKQIEWCENNLCPIGSGACGGDPTVDCRCKQTGKMCGSVFHPKCGFEKTSIYTCRRGNRPTELKACLFGCSKKTHNCKIDSNCNMCVCSKASGAICGNEFDPRCGLDSGAVYECRAAGATPVLNRRCVSELCNSDMKDCMPVVPKECKCKQPGPICSDCFQSSCKFPTGIQLICNEAGQVPRPAEWCKKGCNAKDGTCSGCGRHCRCPTKGQICGSSFDRKKCRLNPGGLYNCPSAGRPPKLIKWCPGGVCLPDSNDCTYPPVDDCTCKVTQNVVCGSTFDPRCGLVPSALYQCVGEGTKPAKIISCESKICTPGDSKCGTNEKCLCKTVGSTCGSTYPIECNYRPDTVYTCLSAGIMPTKTAYCDKGCDKVTGMCNPDDCGCKKVGDVCGSAFDPECNLDPNTLYSCRTMNVIPTFAEKCTTGKCDKDTGACVPADCECKAAGKICGSSFSTACGLVANSLYTCDAKGRMPTDPQACASGVCKPNEKQCFPNTCLCSVDGLVCGATFPAKCAYESGTLYRCKVGNRARVEQVCESKQCNKDETHCVPANCECPAIGDFCSADFVGCYLAPNALYTCKEVAGKPELKENCKSGSCPAGEHTCGVGKCDCPKAGDICGATFADECKLTPTALYTCIAAGAKPERKLDCPSMSCPKGADKCNPDPCTCTDDKNVCPPDFPALCGLKEDTLYSCKVGEKPKEFTTCMKGTCQKDSHTCLPVVPENCICTKTGDICGSTFPMACGLEKYSLYRCEAGQIPKLIAKCPSGSCSAGETKCTNIDECTCEDEHMGKICGATFADQCGYNKGAVYTCKETGKPPVDEQQCLNNNCPAGSKDCSSIDKCGCTKTGQVCGSAFPVECGYKNDSLYYCADEGDMPKEIATCNGRGCPATANACNPDPCLCKVSGQICGATFPKECRLEEAALYFCPAKEQKPKFIQNCPSNSCPANATQCDKGGLNCDCKRAGQICGSTFDGSCGWDKDTLYYCASKDATPQPIRVCKRDSCPPGGQTCDTLLDCTCKEPGRPCGKSFRSGCNYEPDVKYHCGQAGDTPKMLTRYPPGECEDGDDEYTDRDPCACPGTGLTCGSVLKNFYNCTKLPLKDNSIYSCKAEEYPVLVEDCPAPEYCVPLSPSPECRADPCSCSEEGKTVCGGSMNSRCGLKTDVEYVCRNGTFVRSQVCSYKCNMISGTCVDKCACINDGVVCGSQFPGCGYKNNTLYACIENVPAREIRPCDPTTCTVGPLVIVRNSTNLMADATVPGGGNTILYSPNNSTSSFFESGIIYLAPGGFGQYFPHTGLEYNDTCAPNPCYCKPGETLRCSKTFDTNCSFDPTLLLSCPALGGPPVVVDQCESVENCVETNGTAQCKISPCDCKNDTGTFCGTYWPDECNYPSSTVFSCSSPNVPPVISGICNPLRCIWQGLTANCEPDPCVCKKANTTVCSIDFPKSCKYLDNAVYSCQAIGDQPMLIQACAPDSCRTHADSARCAKNPCSCDPDQVGKQFCSDSFGSDCGLDPNAIYKCEKSGSKPVKIEQCDAGLECAIEDDAPTCHSNECHCSKNMAGQTTCGFFLDDRCAFDDNTIYICPSPDGGVWVPYKECDNEKCIMAYDNTSISMGAVAKCQPDICLCHDGDDGRTLCGSNFDSRCSLQKDSSYLCKAGQPPTLLQDCRPGICFYNTFRGSAICQDPLCKCPAGELTVCGSFFPPRCRLEKSNMFKCNGTLGSDPVFQKDCKPESCEMKEGQAKCREELCKCNEGDETICGHDFDNSCSLPSETIMQCSGRNTVPVPGEDCLPGTCFMMDGKSKCVTPDKCLCDRGPPRDVCGGIAFPGCPGIDNNTLYYCNGTGYSKPVEKQKCMVTEVCSINGTFDQGCFPIIPPNKCVCTGMKKMMCGSEFPKECNIPVNNLYSCDDPNNPVLVSQCEGSTCDPMLGAHCVPIIKLCECPYGATKACGSQLDAYCNTTADTLFDCVSGKPIVNKICDPFKCVTIPDPHCDTPPVPDCKCKADQIRVCGKVFPEECRYAADDLFSCSGPTSTPTKTQTCLIDECIVNNGNDMCKDHTCDCETAGTSHCGTDFPTKCYYADDYVYTCTAPNLPPVKAQDPCSAGCEQVIPRQQAKCKVDPCDCIAEQTVAPQCGSAFPMACNRTADTLYSCDSANQPPVPIMDCKPLTCETVNGIGGCKPNPCFCSDDQVGKDICGSVFPSNCLYPKDTLFNCNKSLENATKVIDCVPETCEQGPDGRGHCTTPNPCGCSASQVGKTLCGSQFLSNCSYPIDTLFQCDKVGELPTEGKPCDPQICEVDNAGIGFCVDDCRCTDMQSGKMLCGTQFPASCMLLDNTLYYCSMPGEKPTVSKDCLPQKCNVASGTGSCAPNPCLCTKDQVGKNLCGSQFQSQCGYINNTLFTCIKEGDKPEASKDCSPRTCDVNNDQGECNVDPCLCTDAQTKAPQCGSAFPTNCPVERDTLYTCANVGDRPAVSKNCLPQKCQMVGNVGSCTTDPCGCPKAQVGKTLCGSQFPPACNFPNNTLFTCPTEGLQPTPGKDCLPQSCEVKNDTGSCAPDPCVCTAAQVGNNYCGSQFPSTCGLLGDTLYTCNNAGVKPTVAKDCLPQTCDIKDDATGACAPDPCACTAAQLGKTLCGSQFPSDCLLPKDTLYTCTKEGDKPAISRDCLPQTCNVVGDSGSCAPDPCLCTAAQVGKNYCGSQFPTCSLAKDSQYTCLKEGDQPSLAKNCLPLTCNVNGDTGLCAPDPCACTAAQVGKNYCGSQFPTCSLAEDTLYTCAREGVKPSLSKDCLPQPCNVVSGTGVCAPDPCLCTTAQVGKNFCGSQFPTCPLADDTLYTCAREGVKPTLSKDCLPQACNVVSGTGSCAPDPCLCTVAQVGKTLCGSQFPGCSLPSNTLYACNKAGDKPTLSRDCLPQTCAVTNGVGACTTDPCACIDEMATKCGSSFPDGCFAKESVFTCTGLKDKTPSLIENCEPFRCIQDVGPAQCEKDPCLCSKEGIECGSKFPGCPGINADYLYSCSTGKVPVELAQCAVGGCDPVALTCEPKPCTCKTTGQVCGSALDAGCGFKNDSTYTCSEIGKIPVFKENCPKNCIVGTGTCAIDPCICTKDELICGSALPKGCNSKVDTLYECKIGQNPVEKQQCMKDGCIAGTTSCTVDPCKCTADQGTCSKDYPSICNLVANSVYDCSGAGAIPNRVKQCASDEICSVTNLVASCVPDCTCKDTNDKCGIDISWKCGLNNDTLYSCSAIGAQYAEKQRCLLGACRSGTRQCAVDPCACTKIGAICGKDFPSTCTNLAKDTVYICNSVGGTAIRSKDCGAGMCANGDCPVAPVDCVCPADGPWCGSEIIKDCPDLDPDLYYACLKGTKPFPFDRCSGGKPTNGQCLCHDTNTICSSYFPFECGYRQDMIQLCTGGAGSKPIKDQQCAVGRCTAQRTCDKNCMCPDKTTRCGNQFDPVCGLEDARVYTCANVGATPRPGQLCASSDRCVVVVGIPKCLGECDCANVDNLCGAALPDTCGLSKTSIYRCDYSGATPTAPKVCQVPCNPQFGPDKCGQAF